MGAPRSTNGKHTIPAVCNALELVHLLAGAEGETTTTALALRLGVPRTTCYRILRSLLARDWIRPLPGGRHALSLGLLPLLDPLRAVEQLADVVQPELEFLTARTRLTAKASVRQGDCAVTVARCQSPQETSVAVRLGASFHLAYGSSGTVLLHGIPEAERREILDRAPAECWAHQRPDDVERRLRDVRRKGWCADLGAYLPSCHAVSAPVRDARGELAASLTLIGFPHQLPASRLALSAKLLVAAARRVERELRQAATARAHTTTAQPGKR